MGGAQSTPASPQSWHLSEDLRAALNVWHLVFKPDFTFTHDAPAPAPAGSRFPTSAGNIFNLALALEWSITDHFTVGTSGAYSPPSTITGNTAVTFDLRGLSYPGNANLSSDSTTGGGGLSFGWDQDSEGRFSTAVEVTADLAWYRTTQQLERLVDRAGQEISVAAIADYCAAHPLVGACRLRGFRQLLVPHSSSLGQFRLAAGITETVLRKNDVGLTFAYYLYTDDPTQIGSYSFATLGRHPAAGGSYSFGEGISIAPQRFSLRADYARRFLEDRLQVSGSFTFAYYVNDPDGVNQGYETDLGLKVRYNVSKRWRLWVAGTAARAVDATSVVSWSGNGAAGVRAKF